MARGARIAALLFTALPVLASCGAPTPPGFAPGPSPAPPALSNDSPRPTSAAFEASASPAPLPSSPPAATQTASAAGRSGVPVPPTAARPAVSLDALVDTETHIAAAGGSAPQIAVWAANAIRTMDASAVRTVLLVPAPVGDTTPQFIGVEDAVIRTAAGLYPERLAFVLGGDTLNPLIQQAVRAGTVTAELRAQFEQKASAIAASGAKGFGEMAALHFSFSQTQTYEFAPPDHPLLLTLSDIAARSSLPIHLHMEAVPSDMALPRVGQPLTNLNPPRLVANVAGLERLLARNRQTPILWEQTGWDNTGFKTPALLRGLLAAHSNLYLSLKRRNNTPANMPLDRASGRVVPAWRDLIEAYPDRFVIGSDTFLGQSNDGDTLSLGKKLVEQLSAATARAVGIENARRLYRLAG